MIYGNSNKMTKATFVTDIFKNLLVSLVLEVPLIAGIVKIVHYAGQDAILRIVSWTIAFMCVPASPSPKRPC